jgi:transcriptional regulator with XRE-family HTH domain
MTTVEAAPRPVGEQLRGWRERRRMSQLDLAIEADISTRHLSFVETGRSKPSREMVLHLAERLDVPLRERNGLLLAAGYAPAYRETTLRSPALAPVAAAVRRLLAAHEPYPAVVVNARSELLDANASVAWFLDGIAPHLLEPPANTLRIALHPDGMAPRIVNLPLWRSHLLDRLRRQYAVTGDPALATLHAELAGYPGGAAEEEGPDPAASVALPMRYHHNGQTLNFLTTIATFGAPMDVTVAELAIESFYPADEATATALRTRTDL